MLNKPNIMNANCPVLSKNENKTDRIIRVVAGAVILAAGLIKLSGGMLVTALVAGTVLLFTGLVGSCALYTLLGINTLKK